MNIPPDHDWHKNIPNELGMEKSADGEKTGIPLITFRKQSNMFTLWIGDIFLLYSPFFHFSLSPFVSNDFKRFCLITGKLNC